MKFKECLNFVQRNQIAWFSTVDKNQPRVRALQIWFADETGFNFQIGGSKDIHSQIKNNPNVEFAFFQPDDVAGIMMRVTGKVEFLDDPELKKKVLEDRPFLKKFGLKPESPLLVIFRISKGEAHFWTFENDAKPKQIIKFGNN